MEYAKMIRRYLKALEAQADLVQPLRAMAKTENGNMSEIGKNLLAFFKHNGFQQAYVAKLLDITPGAVSQHYAKH